MSKDYSSPMDLEILKPALELLERCHTALSDVFPHEGTRAIGGSRIFIGTALFPVLKDGIRNIRKHLKKWTNFEARNEIDPILAAAGDLLIRIGRQGRQGDAQRIDKSVRLLYLANGTIWNYLCGFAVDAPPHNPQYVRIEPMKVLLKRCGRGNMTEGDVDPKSVLQ